MSDVVDFSRRGPVGVITVNSPPVNALGAAVREGLMARLAQGLADPEVKAMVLIGGGRTFIAGADIKEFADFAGAGGPDLNEINAAYESAGKPVVAAIHGTALGGGLEIALACHYRVAVATAQVGLPEVKLGLLPGAGGTQRLPRLVGAETALNLIARGIFVAAPQARQMGIVDELVEGDLLDGAVAFAEKLVRDRAPLKKVRDLKVTAEPKLFEDFRAAMAREAKGFFAPWKCIDCVEIATRTDLDEGLRRERELFNQCLDSKESKAQIHIFFAEREVSKIPDVPKDTTVLPFRTGAVLGCGTMGGGIAMNFANAGIPVAVLESSQEALDRGMAIIRGNYEGSVKRGRMSEQRMHKALAMITPTLDYGDIAQADVVIEAVFEEMEIKQAVFRRLDGVMKDGAVLATNTSTLDIDAIAAETKRPEMVIGTHFFSPANVMRLLEVVRGAKTSKETIATAMALGRKMGKVAVLVGNCDGFVGNRMLAPYMREAEFLVEEGATPQQVDAVFNRLGFAMGPFTMSDMAGVDVSWRIEKRRRRTRSNELRTSFLIDAVAEQGRYGQKTSAGWYRYEAGSRAPLPDPEVERLLVEHSRKQGIERRTVSDDEILKRCLYSMINEGALCLEEGMAIRASDIDVIYTAGYGVPVYLGGPMWYANQVGLKAIHDEVTRFAQTLGPWWRPSELLGRLGAAGKTFVDYDRGDAG